MASIFGRTLGADALRALPIFESGIARGLSLNQIQFRLNRAGFNITLTENSLIVEAILEQRAVGKTFLDLPLAGVIDYANLPPALTSTLRDYSFVVRLEGVNPFTGQPHIRRVTVSTDRFLTRGEIEDIAVQFARNDVLGYEQVEIQAFIEEGRRRVLMN